MSLNLAETDQFFLSAETLARDAALAPGGGHWRPVATDGLLTEDSITETCERLKSLGVDKYIEQTVNPSEDKGRPGVKSVLKKLEIQFLREVNEGPLYGAEIVMDFHGRKRRLGVLAQERSVANGVWMPEHHKKAVELIRDFADYNLPVVTFIDTPGADAGEAANAGNQAHAISHLIAEMANVDLPTLGIIFGNGYSGGAIPLATTNLLLSVKDGVFNTIQPRGLASIARKYELSWQECAKYVGVSSFELYQQGYLDGIIDYSPSEKNSPERNLQKAIVSGILSIEEKTKEFVNRNPHVFDHYQRSIARYLKPSEELSRMESISELSLAKDPTSMVNVFGVMYRYLRYLCLRSRITSTTTTRYGRLSNVVKPHGDLTKRREEELNMAFSSWLENPLQIKYDDMLNSFLKNYEDKKAHADDKRNRVASLIFGDPRTNFDLARDNLRMAYGFHLYNTWKAGARSNFLKLIARLVTEEDGKPLPAEPTVLDVVHRDDLRQDMIAESHCLLLFDTVYDELVKNLRSIAREAKDYNIISRDSVVRLVEGSIEKALKEMGELVGEDTNEDTLRSEFSRWIRHIVSYPKRGQFFKAVEEWKRIVHPRVSEPLFAIMTFFFETLLPRYYESEAGGGEYDGRINPKSIGLKDFWNRLRIAYTDLLVNDVLLKDKKNRKTPQMILDHFFYDFQELDADLMSRDPANFPGFRISIEQSLEKQVQPCGVVTGIGRLRSGSTDHRVGVVVSNLPFQAGAFDMASGEKFCRLLMECSKAKLPVVCFISSGGMQTKEGAGALFSMSIVNDRITRFVRDNDLPIICFGFGDCTGGAQASFVTHPLVQTYYFSGTNMPFAGQIVVPSYLPSTATLSNFLASTEGSMKGLVKHPFYATMDEELREIDPTIAVGTESVEEVCERILAGSFSVTRGRETPLGLDQQKVIRPVEKVLIHARGCTAVKLIKVAQRRGLPVVLAQSDADMESVPAEMLGPEDSLICIGGNTPDESYLNAMSILQVAQQEGVDSLHPGIGFLSENAGFASLCTRRGLNFIGPDVSSMERMGNKSNAISTAMACGVEVVPGSHGILSDVESAASIADQIGYPVLLKAVHGGGGKGIQVVERPEDFAELFHRISAEARAAFGSGDLYLEKYVTSLRHVEIQVLRDTHGNTKVLGLRDCSVQRNNQKIIEESSSTLLSSELQEKLFTFARDLSDEIGYLGAGTVEFIFDLANQAVYFMEMNTRLQVEHPVTEEVTGIDIVGEQFNIASGGSIEALDPKVNGYAMEVRITAEKATLDAGGQLKFMPHPGEIIDFVMPEDPKVHCISMVEKGKTITPYYDSLIMQVVATGTDRNDTIETLYNFLDRLVINGVCTNISLVKKILKDEVFVGGDYDTTFLTHFLDRVDIKALIDEIEAAAGEDTSVLDLDTLRIEGTDEIKVLSSQAGVFYLTPSPTEPEFVSENAIVDVDQTLCLLEAMKLFNATSLASYARDDQELYPSTQKYQVVRIVPVNGQAVNKGDLLFVIKPVSEG